MRDSPNRAGGRGGLQDPETLGFRGPWKGGIPCRRAGRRPRLAPLPWGTSQALSEVFAMATPHFWVHIYIKHVSRRVWAEDTGSMASVRVSLTQQSVALSPRCCWGVGGVSMVHDVTRDPGSFRSVAPFPSDSVHFQCRGSGTAPTSAFLPLEKKEKRRPRKQVLCLRPEPCTPLLLTPHWPLRVT